LNIVLLLVAIGMIIVPCNFGSFKLIRFRPDANEQQARCRARKALAQHPEYDAAISANPALKQVIDLALVAQVEKM
jgi:hypothetical protein